VVIETVEKGQSKRRGQGTAFGIPLLKENQKDSASIWDCGRELTALSRKRRGIGRGNLLRVAAERAAKRRRKASANSDLKKKKKNRASHTRLKKCGTQSGKTSLEKNHHRGERRGGGGAGNEPQRFPCHPAATARADARRRRGAKRD